MIKYLLLFLVCLSMVPAFADDPAVANRLLVEAAKFIKAANTEDGASEKLALLESALTKLNEIVEHHPSSDLAVKLITDQPIGSLSLAELTNTVERLRASVARQQRRGGEITAGGPHLAAVSQNTNFLLQIDLERLNGTQFEQRFQDLYERHMEISGSGSKSQRMEVLSAHLQRVKKAVLAADMTHFGDDAGLEQFADALVVQLTFQSEVDVHSLMEALSDLPIESGKLLLEELVSHSHLGYAMSHSNGGDRFYVLPSPDAKALFFGLRLKGLVAAVGRYVSGDLVVPEDLVQPGVPDAQVSLSAIVPRSLRERFSNLDLLDQFSDTPELPLGEILGSAFEIGQVFVDVTVDRHVAVEVGLEMETAMSANIFFVMGNTFLLPALTMLDKGFFVSDPVLELEDLHLQLRFELDGDTLLNRIEESLNAHAPVSEPGALTQSQSDEDVEQMAIEHYLGYVFQKLESHKRYPRVAERSGLNGRVVLRFTVRWDGEVLNPEVVEVVGHDSFRQAALQALTRVGQLPQFPDEIRRRELQVEVPLTYSLSDR